MNNNNNIINENEKLKYQVILNGIKVFETPMEMLAEQYIAVLPLEQKMSARVIPVTQDNKQFLLG